MIHSSNTMVDRIVRTGLATPALALTILAGAAFAQTGGGSGRAYEVIVDAPQDTADKKDVRQEVRTVVEINRTVDGKALTVRRVNDRPIVVKLDGKELSKENYKMKDGVVIITMPGSHRTVEVAMPEHHGSNPFVGSITLAEPVQPGVPAQLRARANAPAGWAQAADVAQPASQPKVMLGVVMAEPDGVILEHLGLDAKKAVLLERVVDGLPADKAGLQAKDIIIGFGEKAEPRSADDIRKVLAKAEPGTKVKVKVIRKGHPVTVDLKLEAFNAQALGRAPSAGVGVGDGPARLRLAPGAGSPWQAFEEERHQHHSHMEQAEKAMKQAAEMLARMEHEIDHKAADAHKQASKAIEQAIAAMRQGEAFGLEVEDMRRMQQEAIERLRGDLGAAQERRFWAEHGDEGDGFALTFPGQQMEDEWEDRLDELEERLDRLEHTFDRAIDRMEERTEAMIERLMERLERALDDRDGRRGR